MSIFQSFNIATTASGIFYFALGGSGIASLNHLFNSNQVFKDLTPAVITTFKDKEIVDVGAEWWGSIAFSIMNLGVFTQGAFAWYKNSVVAKQAFLLGVSVLFLAFSAAWFLRGDITGKKNYKGQGIKVGLFGLLFAAGFAITN